MKKALFTFLFLFIANYVVGQIQIVPKLGYVFQHREDFWCAAFKPSRQ